MKIRQQFAQTIANKLVPSGKAAPEQADQVAGLAQKMGYEVNTKADDSVEVNFERVAKVLTGASQESAETLKAEAKESIDAFGNTFIFGYGSMENKNFQSYGDGMFSFEGGNMAQRDVTFMVDTSPGMDGIQYMVLDNKLLPKNS